MALMRIRPELQAFGAEVKRLRETAGLTRTELAKRASVTRSYVGQVETGATRCRHDFAQRLDGGLGTGTALADLWEDIVQASGYPRWFDFPKAESTAVLLRSYQGFVIDGLLQTEDYAQAILVTDAAVAARMRRQAIMRRETPPMLVVLLDESVLFREVGNRSIMKAQLEHLITIGSDRVHVQVVALACYRGALASFAIATQPDRSEVAYLPNAVRGDTSADPKDIAWCTEKFLTLQAHALSVTASRNRIEEIVEERWT